jgi:hypothetical protein
VKGALIAGFLLAIGALFAVPAHAEPGDGGPGIVGNGPGLPGGPSGGTVLVLCPGLGGGVNILGGGGGWCDYGFELVEIKPGIWGNLHTHCEWGGFAPVAAGWQCWRVFPGQPDHPRLLDPDVIPEGWMLPGALTGPTPDDQWPPKGLQPIPPPPPPPEPPPISGESPPP